MTMAARHIPRDADKGRPGKDEGDGRGPAGRRLQRSPGYVEEIFDIIRSDIMALRIPANARISIDQLARDLGVSQTPIREALSMLEAIGLVTRRHYVGYWSAPLLTRDEIDNLYEVRLLLEPQAARAAATRMSDADLKTVGKLIDAMNTGRMPTTYDRFADRDAELHDLIAAGSGNRLIQEALSRLHSHLHIFRLRSNSTVTAEAHQEHMALKQALLARDGDAAEAAMRHHIERSYARLEAMADEA